MRAASAGVIGVGFAVDLDMCSSPGLWLGAAKAESHKIRLEKGLFCLGHGGGLS